MSMPIFPSTFVPDIAALQRTMPSIADMQQAMLTHRRKNISAKYIVLVTITLVVVGVTVLTWYIYNNFVQMSEETQNKTKNTILALAIICRRDEVFQHWRC